eukprot:GFYU01001515.1.p1 GENE.GFYU01001515.1~~GFYU01001515.1.p1  ORF type:complete len:343 (+),score=80.62 GFYU01001515.1:16-1044(+)
MGKGQSKSKRNRLVEGEELNDIGGMPVVHYNYQPNTEAEKRIDEFVRDPYPAKGELFLSNLKLEEVPHLLTYLAPHLKVLGLSENCLRSVPAAVFALGRLEELDMDQNKIEFISPKIYNLQCLKVINLESNKIEEIPEEMFGIQTLTKINLDNNRLREIPPAICYLQKLTALYVRNNQLKEVPPELALCEGATAIDLRDNKLKRLPLEYQKFKSAYIYVEGNPLSRDFEPLLDTAGAWPPTYVPDFLKELADAPVESPRRPKTPDIILRKDSSAPEVQEPGAGPKCLICLERDKCMAVIPCGHMVSCEQCCEQVAAGPSNSKKGHACPVCRESISSFMKIYK